MSLEIVRQVNAQHPELLQQNINSTCYQFVVYVVEALTAAGHRAYLMCKSPGEGQYTPPGFVPRDVVGLDGKPYPCSGVSHDAIWCDDQQYDTIASGNDAAQPIYTDPATGQATFEPVGPQIHGSPSWNAVPSEYWRPNNPPLTEGAPLPPSTAQPPPGREEALNELNWLDAYYMAPEGLQRPQGLSINGAPDFEGVATWYIEVYQRDRMAGQSREDARADYVSQIRHSDEWKQKHPGETP